MLVVMSSGVCVKVCNTARQWCLAAEEQLRCRIHRQHCMEDCLPRLKERQCQLAENGYFARRGRRTLIQLTIKREKIEACQRRGKLRTVGVPDDPFPACVNDLCLV